MPEGLWKQPLVVTQHAGAITALAASPWAPVVAVAGYRQISLYHADTGQLLGVLPFTEGVPYVLRFSRDGAMLLAAGGRGGAAGVAVLYDVKTGRKLAKVGDELDAVLAADLNAAHTRIALGGPRRLVRIYSTETGELVSEIRKHTDWIYAIEYSPDGVLLATADRANGPVCLGGRYGTRVSGSARPQRRDRQRVLACGFQCLGQRQPGRNGDPVGDERGQKHQELASPRGGCIGRLLRARRPAGHHPVATERPSSGTKTASC